WVKRSGLVARARADSQHLALGGFFLGGVGNDDAAGGCFIGLDPLQQNPVLQRPETWHGPVLRLAHSMVSNSRIVRPFALTMINNLGSRRVPFVRYSIVARKSEASFKLDKVKQASL